MRLVYSLGSIGFSGGIERVICTKANYFADVLGYDVHIIVASSKPDNLFYPFSNKIVFHYLDLTLPALKPQNYLFFYRRIKPYKQSLKNKLKQIRPDITISPFGLDASFLYQLKDGSEKILESHFSKNYLKQLGEAIHDDRLSLLRKLWLSMLARKNERIANEYDHVVLLTEQDKRLWGNGERFHVIPNPLSFYTEKAAPLENKLIVAIGRLNEQKGFDLLIKTFALLKDDFPDWRVDIYGKGMKHHEEELYILRKELSLEEHVLFKSPTSEIEDAFLSASIFAFPSRYEGFGLVLTEAMECGLPCVAFDCESGPSEIIDTDQTGFLVPQQNIRLFAESLKKLMLNQELRITMGKKGKQQVKRFYPENIMPHWVELFNKTMK